MTQGRPAALKQVDDRFELDPDGSCGDGCKICTEKKIQMIIPEKCMCEHSRKINILNYL